MAELPSTPPVSATSGDLLEYKPLAAMAIAGFLLGIIMVLVVAGSFLVSMYQGAPIYLPGWVVGMAFVAAVVSFVAEWQVRASEGTRAGAKLARWGLWLSLCSGLGYWVFTYATSMALAHQANQFLMVKDNGPGPLPESGFFEHLIQGSKDRAEFHRAFLLTMPASERNGNPENAKELAKLFDVPGKVGSGRLTQFGDHWLVKAILAVEPDKVNVEPLGIQGWEFDKGAYHVVRHYRITTPEVVLEATLPVMSAEPMEPGAKRTWSMPMAGVRKLSETLTELGRHLYEFRADIAPIVEKWSRHLPDASVPDKTDWQKFAHLKDHGEVRKYVGETLESSAKRISVRSVSTEGVPWKVVDGKVRVWYPIQLYVPYTAKNAAYELDGAVVVESKRAVDLGNPGQPGWQILHVEWTRVALANVPDNTK